MATAFFASIAAALSASAADTGSDPSATTEVLVTAEQREERLQDVPVALTVVNADELERHRGDIDPGVEWNYNGSPHTVDPRALGDERYGDNVSTRLSGWVYRDLKYRKPLLSVQLSRSTYGVLHPHPAATYGPPQAQFGLPPAAHQIETRAADTLVNVMGPNKEVTQQVLDSVERSNNGTALTLVALAVLEVAAFALWALIVVVRSIGGRKK